MHPGPVLLRQLPATLHDICSTSDNTVNAQETGAGHVLNELVISTYMREKQVFGWMVVGLVLLLTGFRPAAEPQNVLSYTVGDVVADFRLRNVDGRMVALSDYKTGRGVLVVFTANHCPFAKAYEDRIIALDRRYAAQGYPVLAIQPNDPSAYEDDSFDNMKLRAAQRSYPFPYLLDETQDVARAFGVTRTPQVYILRRSGEKFTVEYVGAIDDSPQDATGVKRRYVDEALGNLLTDKPVVTTTTKAVGCAIKWKGM